MMNFFAINIYLSELFVAFPSNLFKVLPDNDEKSWLFIVTVIDCSQRFILKSKRVNFQNCNWVIITLIELRK